MYHMIRDYIYKKHRVMVDKNEINKAIRICGGDFRLIIIELSDLIEKERLQVVIYN